MLTAEQLKAFAPHCDAEALAPAISAAAVERRINTPNRLAHLLGQIDVESAGLTRFEENLNYSATRMAQVWPSRFHDPALAQRCAHNPMALANVVYAGRLGNTHADDGWIFRGRGLLQITGRANYDHFGEELGIDLIGHPDLAIAPGVSARIAALYWFEHGLNDMADENDIVGITHAINGGLTGLRDRQASVNRAKAILGSA